MASDFGNNVRLKDVGGDGSGKGSEAHCGEGVDFERDERNAGNRNQQKPRADGKLGFKKVCDDSHFAQVARFVGREAFDSKYGKGHEDCGS